MSDGSSGHGRFVCSRLTGAATPCARMAYDRTPGLRLCVCGWTCRTTLPLGLLSLLTCPGSRGENRGHCGDIRAQMWVGWGGTLAHGPVQGNRLTWGHRAHMVTFFESDRDLHTTVWCNLDTIGTWRAPEMCTRRSGAVISKDFVWTICGAETSVLSLSNYTSVLLKVYSSKQN